MSYVILELYNYYSIDDKTLKKILDGYKALLMT